MTNVKDNISLYIYTSYMYRHIPIHIIYIIYKHIAGIFLNVGRSKRARHWKQKKKKKHTNTHTHTNSPAWSKSGGCRSGQPLTLRPRPRRCRRRDSVERIPGETPGRVIGGGRSDRPKGTFYNIKKKKRSRSGLSHKHARTTVYGQLLFFCSKGK